MVTAAKKLKDTCSLEGKLLGSVVKGRDIILPTKVHTVKAMIFPVVRALHFHCRVPWFDPWSGN